MAIVPKKNISRHLHDIKHDKAKISKKSDNSGKFFILNHKKSNKKENCLKYLLTFGFISVLILGSIYTISVKNSFADSFNFIAIQAQLLKNSIFKTTELKNSISAINNEIQNIENKANNYGIIEIIKIIGQFNSSLKEVPGAFQNITSISEKSSKIANNIDYLKNNALQLIFNEKGGELVEKMKQLENDLDGLEKLMTEFKIQASKIKDVNSNLNSLYKTFDENYLSIVLNIYKAKELVSAINSLLQSPEDTKILLLFQNPTEIRPAGGFIGSFGYLTINSGSIKEIKIDDIYNADRQLNISVAPPKQLSAITTIWGARDANWFFDFTKSAEKVAHFLENSKLFSETQTKFENIISINTNLFKSLMEITGPVYIPEYDLTINSENFLKEIQYEVEAGKDHKPGQNPKKVLSVLAPILIEKIKNLDNDQKIKLTESLKRAVAVKDLMAFSKNTEIQKIFSEYGLSGELFNIPKYFNGDYLAVVNSNIAGGKSDAFISQQIFLQSQISEDGTIYNSLSISRTHTGQNEKDWWYRSTNKNFLKIFLPLNAEILSVSGNDDSPYTYKTPAQTLLKDEDLKNIENTYTYIEEFKSSEGVENNKKTIATWLNTPAGKTKELKITYKEEGVLTIKNGAEIFFIFDKQSGCQGSLEYEIAAPPGYIWKETQNTKLIYGTQEILSREKIKLTLERSFN